MPKYNDFDLDLKVETVESDSFDGRRSRCRCETAVTVCSLEPEVKTFSCGGSCYQATCC